MSVNLFSRMTLGPHQLANRIFMAPMTRSRCGDSGIPTQSTVKYYQQRASAGLLISEATQVSPQGIGYLGTPGMYTAQQVAGWQAVTDAVHAAGGKIFQQLFHVGRISHPLFQPQGHLPVSATAIAAAGNSLTPQGPKPFPVPRALLENEIAGVVAQFQSAAQMSLAAGFDGVEIHAANGYLIDQFLRDGVNQRTDAYGGSPTNRIRFLQEIVQATASVWGADRVGVRLSPSGTFNDMQDSAPRETFTLVAKELNQWGLAYLHIIEAQAGDLQRGADPIPVEFFRPLFQGPLIANGGFTKERGNHSLSSGHADAIAFGVPFLANPDLPARLSKDAALNPADSSTFYQGGDAGYIDYPALA